MSNTILSEIQFHIRDIEANTTLFEKINFDERADALDFIDFHIIDRMEGLLHNAAFENELHLLKQQAEQLKRKLEVIDINLFKQLRQNISDGVYAKTSFKTMIDQYLGYDVSIANKVNKPGYDNLDIFINGLLASEPLPEATLAPQPEMVFYQQTPARIIFQLATVIKREDAFVDIGSGLGQVAILVNLLTGATTKGIEYEPAYCAYAKSCAEQLNLTNVEFINADARDADYSHGTVFFLYTPFTGSILQEVLHRLQQEAHNKTIRIFTYGPCSPIVAEQDWLKCLNGDGIDGFKLWEFEEKKIINCT
jgi:hypothetical protein